MPLTTHSERVGLICRVMHADPLMYESCFFLSQTDTLKIGYSIVPSAIYMYIHRLPTHLPLLPNKMQLYRKCYDVQRLWKNLEEGPSSNSSKKLVFGNHTCTDVHSKRTCSTDSFKASQSGHSCYPPPLLSCLPNSSYNPWVPERNSKNNLEGAPLTYSKYSSNPISRFKSL